MFLPISLIPPSAITWSAPFGSRGGGFGFGTIGTEAAEPPARVTATGRSRLGPGRSARSGGGWRGSAGAADHRHPIPAAAAPPWRTPGPPHRLSLIHISEPTRRTPIS